MLIAGASGWWLRGSIMDERLQTARERVQVADERIKFAEERQQQATTEREKLQEQVNELLSASKVQPIPAEIAERLRRIQTAVEALGTADKAVAAALKLPGEVGYAPLGLGMSAAELAGRRSERPRRALPIDAPRDRASSIDGPRLTALSDDTSREQS
jgi:hypothetical protein